MAISPLLNNQINTQIPLNFSIGPSNNYLVVSAGGEAKTTLVISNPSQLDLLVTPSLKSFTPNDFSNQITLSPILPIDISTFTLTQKTQISSDSATNTPLIFNQSFLLPAQTEQKLELTIKPPLGQEEKEYYFSPSFSAIPNHNLPANQNTGTQLSATIGSNLIISVSDQESDQSQLQFADTQLSEQFIVVDSFSGKKLTFPAINLGHTSTLAQGSITITQDKNQSNVASYQFFPDLFLPEQTKNLRFTNQDYALATQPQLEEVVPYFQNQFLFGRYNVTAQIGSAHHLNTNPPQLQNISIFFFPIYFVGAVTIAALLLLTVFLAQKVKQKNRYR